jgi:hypothetical protein
MTAKRPTGSGISLNDRDNRPIPELLLISRLSSFGECGLWRAGPENKTNLKTTPG